MTLRLRLLRRGVDVQCEEVLGRGGEATVHAVRGDPALAAKVYHAAGIVDADKLTYLVDHPWQRPDESNADVAWPRDVLLDGAGRVRGFVMPRLHEPRALFEVYNPLLRRRLQRRFHWADLVGLARALAGLVAALHERGDVVIGDLNESNVMVDAADTIWLVDADSFQVAGARVHRCRVCKPEYLAPELQGTELSTVDRDETHDRFALAVLLFQLLMEGTHPFSARYVGAGRPPSLEERIGRGMYPRGVAETRVVPPPGVPDPAMLGESLARMLLDTFQGGHFHPTLRCSAVQWHAALTALHAALVPCPANDWHHHLPWLPCGWCARQPAETAATPATRGRPARTATDAGSWTPLEFLRGMLGTALSPLRVAAGLLRRAAAGRRG